MIAKIAVSAAAFAIDKPYSYRIPLGMRLQPGHRVRLPFGRGNTTAEGIVLAVEEGSEENLKAVESCLDEEPILTQEQLYLAAFMRERYFCTFYEAIRAILPAGLWFDTREVFSLTEDRSWEETPGRNKQAMQILALMRDLGGTAKEELLRQLIEDEEQRNAALNYLLRKKWITSQTELRRRTSDKTEKIVTLVASPEEAMEYASSRGKSASQQKQVLQLLCGIGSVSVKELCYFTGVKLPTLRNLEKKGYLALSERPVLRCSQIRPAVLEGPLTLNPEQENCYRGICLQLQNQKPGSALLYGITGSGKTAVYIKLIQDCLDRGRSAMLLVPEIALTPQLLGLLAAYFGEAVAVLHSSLSDGERYDQWKRIRTGNGRVIIGTRSAVFAPREDLGLIILDEEQERSYQSENSPRYDAREVALWRGNKEGALVLFGSATPSIETMYRAKSGLHQLYTLRHRYNGRPLPRVDIVDMRQELKMGNDLCLSDDLRMAIADNLAVDKQSILLLNRRGNSRCVVCVDCRKIPECPRCAQRLTYHSANNRLMCHYCGHSQLLPDRCPSCGGPMKALGIGTQKVVQQLQELFPDMEALRMDTDTVSAVNTHEKILDHFRDDKVPVLVGTQMVAKGLNMPNVTLVGVLDADLGLYTGGYRSAETTFDLLTQVVGRAGRGQAEGRAMIQTMVPEHAVINLAARQDYDGFYDLEIGLRRVQNAPPFGDLAAIVLVGQDEAALLRSAAKLADSLRSCLRQPDYLQESCTVLGPAPCVVPKINYHFRYQLTLRCHMTKRLRQLLAHLLRQFSKDKWNRGVSAFVDIHGGE